MKQRQFYFALLMVLLTVMFLSIVWEFWLEDLLGEIHGGDYEPENRHERWEFVTTVFTFSLISLIYPAILGRKAIIEHLLLYDRYMRSSREDYLTGLHNRRQISENLSNEVNRCTRYGKVFSLVLLDIDDFKETNDRFGHLAGDALLKQVANLLREETRASDLLGRWGGEEFLIICPETDVQGASTLANKIRDRLQGSDFGQMGRKTASFGVAGFEPSDDIESIVHRADEALYGAKQAGKNRVKIAASGATQERRTGPHS